MRYLVRAPGLPPISFDNRLDAHQWAIDWYTTHYLPIADLEPLRGHDLMCWCPTNLPCHADTLLR